MSTEMKLNPSQVVIEAAGRLYKHVIVSLRAAQSIDALRESPSAWASVQANLGLVVRKGDEVTILAPDGLTKADRCTVTRALGGQVWLGAPLRLVTLEADSLFGNGHEEVVPYGDGYSIKTVRDGRVGSRVFRTAKQAENEILRRSPVRMAS